jgi:hypothetical protein
MKGPGALRLLGLALVLLALAVPPLLARPGPGAAWDDSGPDGDSGLVATLSAHHPVRVLRHSDGALPADAGAGEALFLFPGHRAATDAEMRRVLGFAQRGGLVALAADGRHAGAWLAELGLQVQGVAALLPPGANATCVAAPAPLPDATGDAAPFGAVCLASPTAFPDIARLRAAAPGARSANSTQAVFLDLDGDGELGLGDQGPQPFPMAVSLRHGDGWVVALADGDAWRNKADPQNLAYAEALVAGRGTVYVDSTSDASAAADPWLRPMLAALEAPGRPEAVALACLLLAAAVAAAAAPHARAWLPQRAPLLGDRAGRVLGVHLWLPRPDSD